MRLAHLSVRVLLSLYPRRFRSEFAAEMLDVFEDRYREIALRYRSSPRRTMSLARLLLSTWANVLLSVFSERLKSSQNSRGRLHGLERPQHQGNRLTPAMSAGVGGIDMSSITQNLTSLAQDVRSALREIRRDFRFYAFAALIIGLGVGANTAVFSVMSPLLLRPLPFENPDELVWVARGASGIGVKLSGPFFRHGQVDFEHGITLGCQDLECSQA